MGSQYPSPTAPPQDLIATEEEETATKTDTTTMWNSPPPPYSECVTVTAPVVPLSKPSKQSFPTTEAEVRAILDTSPQSPKSMENLKILHIQPMNAYSYLLETLTERRTLVDITEPYKSQEIDNKHGRIPKKWDVIVKPPISLKNYSFGSCNSYDFDSEDTIPLPNSTRILDCMECSGTGRRTCSNCRGSGVVRCRDCFGTGRAKIVFWSEQLENCRNCTAEGKVSCKACSSCGSIVCWKCKGFRQLVTYRAVQIHWNFRSYKEFTECGDLPSSLLGRSRYWNRLEKVSLGPVHAPLQYVKDDEITMKAQQRLASVVKTQDHNLKVLEVRHRIGEISVIKVYYICSKNGIEEDGYFFIYSVDCKVYFPKEEAKKDKCICM